MKCPGQYVPNMLLEISGEITPERMIECWMDRMKEWIDQNIKKKKKVVGVTGDGSKVQCCKEQYYTGT